MPVLAPKWVKLSQNWKIQYFIDWSSVQFGWESQIKLKSDLKKPRNFIILGKFDAFQGSIWQPSMGQTVPKWENLVLFQIRVLYILAWRAKIYWNLTWKAPDFGYFWNNFFFFFVGFSLWSFRHSGPWRNVQDKTCLKHLVDLRRIAESTCVSRIPVLFFSNSCPSIKTRKWWCASLSWTSKTCRFAVYCCFYQSCKNIHLRCTTWTLTCLSEGVSCSYWRLFIKSSGPPRKQKLLFDKFLHWNYDFTLHFFDDFLLCLVSFILTITHPCLCVTVWSAAPQHTNEVSRVAFCKRETTIC